MTVDVATTQIEVELCSDGDDIRYNIGLWAYMKTGLEKLLRA